MNRSTLGAGVCAAALMGAGIAGCSQMSVNDKPITNVDTVTGVEWEYFAENLLFSIDSTGVFERYRGPNGQPVVIAMGDFVNKTSNPRIREQKDFMYSKVRATLVNSGKAEVRMDIAGTGGTVDELLRSMQAMRNSPNFDAPTMEPAMPRLILHGSFNEIRTQAGRSTQMEYQAWCILVDVDRGVSVWEGPVDLRKKYTRGILGG